MKASESSWTQRILVARGLRAFADGYVAVLLPAYLVALGMSLLDVGLLSTATLAGSAAGTLAIGAWAGSIRRKRLLRFAALLMAATGLAFAGLSDFWPLALVAFVGTLNPSSGDVSIFLPLEQAELAGAVPAATRGERNPAPHAPLYASLYASLFARYTLAGSLFGALGALASAVPAWLSAHSAISALTALRLIFVAYAALGALVWFLYRGRADEGDAEPVDAESGDAHTGHANAGRSGKLGPSRAIVLQLAALFSVDSFASGLLVNSMLSAWLMARFGMSLAATGAFFFWAGLLSTASQLLAPPLARRIGLLRTMVFTHLPASGFLIAAAFAGNLALALGLLLARSALSQMDVPARTAFVMASVTPPERVAAASFTAVPKSLASAVAPTLSGLMHAGGWLAAPLLACGALKIGYDLALLFAFRRHEKR